MEFQELADILRGAYEAAPEGEKVVRIVLFGIEYAEELGIFSPNRVARAADIPPSYYTEINRGRSVAKYVELKKAGETLQ